MPSTPQSPPKRRKEDFPDLFEMAYQEGQKAAQRARLSAARHVFDPALLCFPKQREAVCCVERFQAWHAGRGSGKTSGAEFLLTATALAHDNVQVFYVSTTIKRALATVWDSLVALNADHNLGGNVHAGNHCITYPNRSRLWVTGIEDKRAANDLRGRKRVKLHFVDEAQDHNQDLLRYFVDSVVRPRMTDVRGALVLAGTGGAKRGYWYTKAHDPSWTHFHWTQWDNPHMPEGEADKSLADACRDRGVDVKDPTIQREFYAAFVDDSARQVLAPAKLIPRSEVPRLDIFFLGFDYGAVDAWGGVAFGCRRDDPRLFIVEARKEQSRPGQPAIGSSDQVRFTREMVEKYRELGLVADEVGDPGGGGRGIMNDLANQADVLVETAEKLGKPSASRFFKDALRSGRVLVCSDLAERDPEFPEEMSFTEELLVPEWDPEKVGEKFANHWPDRADAALYAHRAAASWFRAHPPPPEEDEGQRITRERLEWERQEQAARSDGWS